MNSFSSHNLCYINCNFDNKAAENKSSLVSCVGVWLCLYKFRYPHYFISICLSTLLWISMLCVHVLLQHLGKISLRCVV